MNIRISTVVAAALIAPTLGAQAAVDAPSDPVVLKLGSTVSKDITLADINGKSVSFKELRGKVVFVHFWSLKCPAIKQTQARLSAIHKDFGKDVVVLGINSNADELGAGLKVEGDAKPFAAIREHAKKTKINYPILVDKGNKIADLFQAKTTPHCYVIDKKGVLRYAGSLDNDQAGRRKEGVESYVRRALTALTSEDGEYENKATKPYG